VQAAASATQGPPAQTADTSMLADATAVLLSLVRAVSECNPGHRPVQDVCSWNSDSALDVVRMAAEV
jgi:hypothetical protein